MSRIYDIFSIRDNYVAIIWTLLTYVKNQKRMSGATHGWLLTGKASSCCRLLVLPEASLACQGPPAPDRLD